MAIAFVWYLGLNRYHILCPCLHVGQHSYLITCLQHWWGDVLFCGAVVYIMSGRQFICDATFSYWSSLLRLDCRGWVLMRSYISINTLRSRSSSTS